MDEITILREDQIFKLPDGRRVHAVFAEGVEAWLLWLIDLEVPQALHVSESGKVLEGYEEVCTLEELEDTGYFYHVDTGNILLRS